MNNMITLKNPTDKELKIQYKGAVYTIPASGSAEIPEEVALYWVGKIHQFLEVEGEKASLSEEKEPVIARVIRNNKK